MISLEQLEKELKDTLIHRACVMRSGEYLANYLSKNNRSVDAIRLLGLCSLHDMSKIQNIEEFLSLASIVDSIKDMHDVEHILSEKQKAAIDLHWSHNPHHAEFYENQNDMTDMNLLEMACDCHARSKQFGTDLLSYIKTQQDARFHFDKEHYEKLLFYCGVLVKLTKNDDYRSVRIIPDIHFSLKDSTMSALEHFDVSNYPELLKTDRLYLRREENADFACVEYAIYQRSDDCCVGMVSLKCNGYLEYNIFKHYVGNFYASEAIKKIVEVSKLRSFKMNVRQDSPSAKEIAKNAGFIKYQQSEDSCIYRLRK